MSESNFAVAFDVLAPARKEAIRAVYGFCRRADDAVDEPSDPSEARSALQRVRSELDGLFGGRDAPEGPLHRVVREFRLPRQPFEDLLEGVRWDLEGRRYETTEDLREYCYRVAGTVGLLCVRIFGCEAPECDRYAVELGVAMQWTNILRDVARDLERNRVYLPSRSLAEHGLTEADLRRPDGGSRGRLDRLIRAEAAYARRCFAEADRILPDAERSRALAGSIMAAVYRTVLRKIERAGAAVLDRRIRVSKLRRRYLAARILLADRLAGRSPGVA